MEAQPERRKLRRIALSFPGSIKRDPLAPDILAEGSLVNLTVQGAAFESPLMMNPSDTLALSFSLQAGTTCEVANAKVIYCRPVEGERHLAGMVFIDFKKGDFEKLDWHLKTLKLMQKTVLFNQLSLDEMRRIVSISREEKYPSDRGIFAEGVAAKALYIVLSGAVKISKRNSKGVDEALAVIREGEVFGEMALLDEYPRAASATAHRDTTMLRIDSADFKGLMSEQSIIANKLLWVFVRVLCHRLREADKQIVETFSSTTSLMGSVKG